MNDKKIGVVGLGIIGLKLAEYLGLEGYSVVAYNWRDIEGKKKQFAVNLDKKVKYEKVGLEVCDRVNSLVKFTDQLSELGDCSIVIDATKEEYSLKENLYASLKNVMASSAILASTTSSLSLARLADSFDRRRFVGMHFFNPPTKMKLVELAFLDQGNVELQNRVYKFLRTLDDKKVIELPPIQGYIVNRLLFVYINAAISFQEESGLSPQSIDEAMRFGTNVPMGPLELSDYIGNDVALGILRELHAALHDERYKPAAKLVSLVGAGKLGKKTKSGFYEY